MARNSAVKLTFTGDSSSFQKAADKAGQSAKDMSKDFDRAADEARTMGKRVQDVGGKVGDQESKFMGLADVLDGTATAFGLNLGPMIDYTRAAGDIAGGLENLKDSIGNGIDAIKKLSVETIKNTVETIKNGVATAANTIKTAAQTVATNAMTVAQKALNLAMRANPILLVVTALAALTGAFILAYKKSETFRDIINGAFDAVKTAAGVVKDGVETAVGAIKTAFDGIVTFLKDWGLLLLGPVGLVVKEWDKIGAGAGAAKDAIVGAFKKAVEWLGGLADKIAKGLTGVASALAAPFEAAWRVIKPIFDSIKSAIDFITGFFHDNRGGSTTTIRDATRAQLRSRHTGGVVPGPPGRPTSIMALGGERISSPGQSGGGGNTFIINALDPKAAATAVRQALQESVRRNGPIPGVAG